MNIVYVSDNRCRGNYGCRATSTALSQLVQKNHKIVGRVSGKNTNFSVSEFFFYKGLPKLFYLTVAKFKYWPYLRKFMFVFAKYLTRKKGFFYSNFDFVSLDLDKSISNLIKCIPANPELNEFNLNQYDFDALVVNGEGSFIFSEKPWRESLIIAMEIYWAQKLGKKVYFVNSMFSDDPYSQRNYKTIELVNGLIGKCDFVSVREYESLKYVNKFMTNINAVVIPDALFTWYNLVNDKYTIKNGKYFVPFEAATDESYNVFDFSDDYFIITGSSSTGNASDKIEKTIDAYVNLTLTAKKKLKMNCFLVEACEGDDYLHEVGKRTNTSVIHLKTPILAAAKIIANAKIYITGRYHPAIMASLGGTPCVFMSSNSHKTKSLQSLLEYDDITEFNLIPNKIETENIVNAALYKLSQGLTLRNTIKERAYKLSLEAERIVDFFN